ncbi:MAG: acyltransferase [Bacteroidetes bacterium]|nr:acyltransferase [Bacteroidota bacterium]
MKKQIPSLNGLRALSIILVVLGHLDQKNWDGLIYNKFPVFVDAQIGVNVFFVISGFLITTLLLSEEQKTGNISFKAFYIKRSLRIFPVYYTLLSVYLLLQLLNILDFTGMSWLTSLTYTKYLNWHADWETGHLWSLSIEEQFYLIWPFVFKFAKNYRKHFAFGLICLVPLLRAFYVAHPIEWMDHLTIFQRVDAIMWGCVFAMYHDKIVERCKAITDKWKYAVLIPFLAIPALSFLTIINHDYTLHMGLFIAPIGGTSGTLADIAICLVIIISIHYANNVWFRFLNTSVMNYLGILSYSIYIWQQLFFSTKLGWLSKAPLNILLIFIVANFSYYVIEKPFLKLKSKFGLG